MAFEWWMATAGANAVLVVVYGAITVEMINAIVRGRQLLTNPLLTATAAIFVTCTLTHGVHLEHAILAGGGIWGAEGLEIGAATRAAFADPRLLWWDVATAIVAIGFYTMRSRFAVVYRGAALSEDIAKREAQALELHDNVVQGLSQAKLALDLGRREEGRMAITRTLEASRRIITELLGKEGSEIALGAGDLRREKPAEATTIRHVPSPKGGGGS